MDKVKTLSKTNFTFPVTLYDVKQRNKRVSHSSILFGKIKVDELDLKKINVIIINKIKIQQ